MFIASIVLDKKTTLVTTDSHFKHVKELDVIFVKAGFSTGVSSVVSLKDSQLMENLEERENRPEPEGRA